MKNILMLVTLFFVFGALAEDGCELVQQEGLQKHFKCHADASTRSFHVLDITGNFNAVAYYHGKFLAHEAEQNLLKGLSEAEERAFNDLEPSEREMMEVLRDCVVGRYQQGASFDFHDGIRSMVKGMRDAGSTVPAAQIEKSHYMVEFSIFTDALKRNMEENPQKMKRELALVCGPQMIFKKIGKNFSGFFKLMRKLKMGCTGIVASAPATTEGGLLHARNFDTGMLGFMEKEPVVLIQRANNGGFVVGLSAAGVPYSAGISGFNSSGLSGSLHELQTRAVQIYAEKYSTDIAPYLLHKVLTQAYSLDQAIAMIQETKGYGAWTFLLADSKTNEVASVEISGSRVAVARRNRNSFMGQSNHFLAPLTREVGFEYSANKTLESISRLNYVTRELQTDFGHIDSKWMMDHLSGHWDEFMGRRSFGRTTTKVYTALSHVMNPIRQEWWMSLGDSFPTNRSAFVGLRLQLDQPVPVQFIGSYRVKEDLASPAWYDSLGEYVQAWMAIELSSRKDPQAMEKGLLHLEMAQALAQQAGIIEYAYHFMWARVQIQLAAIALAKNEQAQGLARLKWAEERLLSLKGLPLLHSFEQGQLIYWQKRIFDLRESAGIHEEMLGSTLGQGQMIFQSLYQQYPGQNLFEKLGQELSLKMNIQEILANSPELVTVE